MDNFGSFVSEFLGKTEVDSRPHASGGLVAVAKDNSRQIVGNIINNYYSEFPRTTEVDHEWLKIQDWLIPSAQALFTQTLVDRDARNTRAEGTCSWLLESEGFREWLRGSKKLEWMHSAIGRGKTTLFSAAVKKTQQVCIGDTAKRACYFYCTARDPSGQDVTVLLRFLLIQLCRPPVPQRSIVKLYEQCHAVYPPSIPTTEDLVQALVETLSSPDPGSDRQSQVYVYIMIDGLDEVPFDSTDRPAILDLLCELSALNMQNVGLFVTSRDQPDIREALTAPIFWNQTPFDSDAVQVDIETYVRQFISKNRRLCQLSPAIRQLIQTTIVEEAGGMFLWTALQLQYLSRLRVLTDATLFKVLKSLPSDLDETYSRLLNEIDETFTQAARTALTWLSFSARTLYIEELIDACAIDLKRAPWDILGPRVTPYQLFEVLHDMISIQPPLPLRDSLPPHNMHRINLCHASVVEFLQGSGSERRENPRLDCFMVEKSSSDLLMARVCLAYLFYYNTRGAKIESFPLLNYAWWQWDKHVDLQEDTPIGIDEDIFRRVAIGIYSTLSRPKIRPVSISASSVHDELSDPAQNFGRKYLKWMPTSGLDRLLKSLDSPFFFPEYDSFFPSLDPRYSVYESLPLSADGTQCRFLELLPCLDADTPINCRLVSSDLESQPRYIAMSYAWQPPNNREIAYINGKALLFPPSQAQICKLLRSRKEGSISRIWIDALCINQDDYSEKNAQLRLMGQILRQAQEVVIILGAEPTDARRGLVLLERLATLTQHGHSQGARSPAVELGRSNALNILQELERPGVAEAFASLYQSQWWMRSWTVQEIALASDASLVMGDISFSTKILERAVYAESTIRRQLTYSQAKKMRRLTSSTGWHAAKQMLRARVQARSNAHIPLAALFWQLRHARTNFPEDRVHSLLNLCVPGDLHFVWLDRSMGGINVRKMFSMFVLKRGNSLESLSIAASSDKDLKFLDRGLSPSWTIDFDVGQRQRRKPLVLGEFTWPAQPRIYASLGKDPSFTIANLTADNTETEKLHLKGFGFDVVAAIFVIDTPLPPLVGAQFDPHNSPESLNKSIQDLFLRTEMYRNRYIYSRASSSPVPNFEARWRTLLADQWPMGQRLGDGLFLGHKLPSTYEEERILLEEVDIDYYDLPFLAGRANIVTELGCLGLAPDTTQRGDQIFMLAGGQVPYILRRQDDGCYELVGECYLDGFMDGEILRDRESLEMEEVILV